MADRASTMVSKEAVMTPAERIGQAIEDIERAGRDADRWVEEMRRVLADSDERTERARRTLRKAGYLR